MTNPFDVLGTPDALARFLVTIGYPRDEVLESIASEFPGADVDAHYEAAVRYVLDAERALDAVIREIEAAAVRAEHDLGSTMHIDLRDTDRWASGR
jgi:hypothetical protein